MRATLEALEGVLMIEPRIFGDERGFFLESFNQKAFDAAVGPAIRFVQDNDSRSARGVLRGMHLQLAPPAQVKLVRVASGSVFDVAADVRPGSATYGRWVGMELSGETHRQLWIPPGFAHGFLVLSANADFMYESTDFYAPAAERTIRWDDPTLAIDWPDLDQPYALSDRDARTPFLGEIAETR